MSCSDRSFGYLPKDTQLTNVKNNDIIATKKLVACELISEEITANNINVDTINNLPISSSTPGLSCLCEVSNYTPSVVTFLGFASGVDPRDCIITRIGNVITITGLIVATNNQLTPGYASAELTLPPAYPPAGTSFVRGSGAYWNNNNDILTGVVLPVHILSASATTFLLSTQGLLPTDGPITFTLQYQIA